MEIKPRKLATLLYVSFCIILAVLSLQVLGNFYYKSQTPCVCILKALLDLEKLTSHPKYYYIAGISEA